METETFIAQGMRAAMKQSEAANHQRTAGAWFKLVTTNTQGRYGRNGAHLLEEAPARSLVASFHATPFLADPIRQDAQARSKPCLERLSTSRMSCLQSESGKSQSEKNSTRYPLP